MQYRLLGLWIHVRISMCAVERMDVFSARWQWTLIGAARGWLMVAKKKCQKSSDQDFHMFQEYLSMYQVLYDIYIYICVRNIYISTIVPSEIDEIYSCFLLKIWSHFFFCQPPVVGPLHDVWRKHRCTPVPARTSLHRTTRRAEGSSLQRLMVTVTVVTWLFHLRLPEFCLKSDFWLLMANPLVAIIVK